MEAVGACANACSSAVNGGSAMCGAEQTPALHEASSTRASAPPAAPPAPPAPRSDRDTSASRTTPAVWKTLFCKPKQYLAACAASDYISRDILATSVSCAITIDKRHLPLVPNSVKTFARDCRDRRPMWQDHLKTLHSLRGSEASALLHGLVMAVPAIIFDHGLSYYNGKL